MKKILLTWQAMFIMMFGLQAQTRIPEAKHISQVPVETLPTLDNETLRISEEATRSVNDIGIIKFAYAHEVNITPQSHGIWESLNTNLKLWRIRIISPSALSINLGFEKFEVPPSAELRIYSPNEEVLLGPYTQKNMHEHGQLWTPVIAGEEIVVEILVETSEASLVEIELNKVNHAFRTLRDNIERECYTDVRCDGGNDWFLEAQSVGMVIRQGQFGGCTGTLINNTANDETPYILTANHCGLFNDPETIVVIWNFENTDCRQKGTTENENSGDGAYLQATTGGAISRARSKHRADFSLLELNEKPDPSYQVTWSGWNRETESVHEAVGIHHPDLEEKRVAFEHTIIHPNDENEQIGSGPSSTVFREGSCYVLIDNFDDGGVEPGSSGSPLYNEEHQIVAQLTGGEGPGCDNDGNGSKVLYGRLQTSWIGDSTANSALAPWLDPLGSAVKSINTHVPEDYFIHSGHSKNGALKYRQIWKYYMADIDNDVEVIYARSTVNAGAPIVNTYIKRNERALPWSNDWGLSSGGLQLPEDGEAYIEDPVPGRYYFTLEKEVTTTNVQYSQRVNLYKRLQEGITKSGELIGLNNYAYFVIDVPPNTELMNIDVNTKDSPESDNFKIYAKHGGNVTHGSNHWEGQTNNMGIINHSITNPSAGRWYFLLTQNESPISPNYEITINFIESPGALEIKNGYQQSGSLSSSNDKDYFYLDVDSFPFDMYAKFDANGQKNIYAKRGQIPTVNDFDWKVNGGQAEEFPNVPVGTWYFMVEGNVGSYAFEINILEPLPSGATTNGNLVLTDNFKFFKIDMGDRPQNVRVEFNVDGFGGSDFALYGRYGESVTTDDWDWVRSPAVNGNYIWNFHDLDPGYLYLKAKAEPFPLDQFYTLNTTISAAMISGDGGDLPAEWVYYELEVPEGATRLNGKMLVEGMNVYDMYGAHDEVPYNEPGTYDWHLGPNEFGYIDNPTPGTWYFLVSKSSEVGGIGHELDLRLTLPINPGQTEDYPAHEIYYEHFVSSNTGELSGQLTLPLRGSFSLHGKHGDRPDSTDYDFSVTGNEPFQIQNPDGGMWYFMVDYHDIGSDEYIFELNDTGNTSEIPPWEPGVYYQIGDLVTYNGRIYECRQSHSSIVTWEPTNALALWLDQGQSNIRTRVINPITVNDKKEERMQISPNPSNNEIHIVYFVEEEGQANLSIYSLEGSKLQMFDLGFQRNGQHEIELAVNDWKVGTYIAVLSTKVAYETKRIVINR